MGEGIPKHPLDPRTASDQSSEFESTRQTHDVARFDLVFECSQFRQVVSVDVNKRCIGVHIISIQSLRVIGEQSLHLGNSGETCY